MKTAKLLSVFLSLTLLLGLLSGCGGKSAPSASPSDVAQSTPAPADAAPASQPEAEADTGVTVVDMKGREIHLDKPAERIVALTASDCEILYAIGAGDTLVGRGTYCDYPAEVLDVTEVASGDNTNIEQIIALGPDVLLMSDMAQTEEQMTALEAAGVHVVISEAKDIAGVYTAIELIGKLMGREDAAAQVIDSMKTTFDTVSAQSRGDGSQTIYFEVSPLQWGLWTAGANTFMDEIAQMLGMRNCFADVDGWGMISEEQVLDRNPDFIVTITMYFGDGPTPEEEIAARPGWENVTAVKNGKILNLQDNELSRPAPRLAQGAQMLFDFLYNEA